jgi:hypothetical protein
MITRTHVLGFFGLMAFAAMLYWAKAEAQGVREEVRRLEREVAVERTKVRVLEAETALLERPDRLEAAARDGLGLVPIEPRRIATLADLDAIAPLPAPPAPALAVAPVAPATKEARP